MVTVPATIALLRVIRRYYDNEEERLASTSDFTLGETDPPTVLVAFEGRSRMSDRALQFAMTLSPDVIALHLLRLEGPEAEEDSRALKARWAAEIETPLAARGLRPPRLICLPAPYRTIHEPLLAFVEKLDVDTPAARSLCSSQSWCSATGGSGCCTRGGESDSRAALLEHGGDRLNVIIAPWRE